MKIFLLSVITTSLFSFSNAEAFAPTEFEIECDLQRSRQMGSRYNNAKTKKTFTQNDLSSEGRIIYVTGSELDWNSDSTYNDQSLVIPYLSGNEISLPIFMTADGPKFALNVRFNLESRILNGMSQHQSFEVQKEVKVVLGQKGMTAGNVHPIDYLHVACRRLR